MGNGKDQVVGWVGKREAPTDGADGVADGATFVFRVSVAVVGVTEVTNATSKNVDDGSAFLTGKDVFDWTPGKRESFKDGADGKGFAVATTAEKVAIVFVANVADGWLLSLGPVVVIQLVGEDRVDGSESLAAVGT